MRVPRFPRMVGEVFNEGYLSVPVRPYAIPYRALLPRYGECDNLLVPVCLSASHVAFSSVRMEPQYMILGHAAGTAASLAVASGTAVQRVPTAALQGALAGQGQALTPPAGDGVTQRWVLGCGQGSSLAAWLSPARRGHDSCRVACSLRAQSMACGRRPMRSARRWHADRV